MPLFRIQLQYGVFILGELYSCSKYFSGPFSAYNCTTGSVYLVGYFPAKNIFQAPYEFIHLAATAAAAAATTSSSNGEQPRQLLAPAPTVSSSSKGGSASTKAAVCSRRPRAAPTGSYCSTPSRINERHSKLTA